jgi:hypothetical protein
LRPWLWPAFDNQDNPVPNELPLNFSGPYASGEDASVLLGRSAGHSSARTAFESAANEQQTIAAAAEHLPRGEHLGDPIDYSAYVVAWLTRERPHGVANFNLDADRGYGYLCWDWVRSRAVMATPDPWREEENEGNRRSYHAPVRPGAGWCPEDIASPASRPSFTAGDPVQIRYLDRENKFDS